MLSRAGDVLMCPHMVPVPLSYWFSLAKEFSGCSPGHKGTHTRLPRTLASALDLSCVVSVGLPQPLRSDCVSHSLCARHVWSGKACTQASRQDTHAPWTRRDLEGGGVRVGRFCSMLVLVPLEFSRCCSAAPRLPGSRGLAHRVSPFPGPKRHEICVYPVHLYRGLPGAWTCLSMEAQIPQGGGRRGRGGREPSPPAGGEGAREGGARGARGAAGPLLGALGVQSLASHPGPELRRRAKKRTQRAG